jgi:hypothetical protein
MEPGLGHSFAPLLQNPTKRPVVDRAYWTAINSADRAVDFSAALNCSEARQKEKN